MIQAAVRTTTLNTAPSECVQAQAKGGLGLSLRPIQRFLCPGGTLTTSSYLPAGLLPARTRLRLSAWKSYPPWGDDDADETALLELSWKL